MSWRASVANGRVFELRTKSTRYPPPCTLIINASVRGYGERIATLVDRAGVVGHGLYARPHNPFIYVDGLRFDDFTSRRIKRRRRDLERFDADDLALIRYGCPLGFDGRVETENIPNVVPATWTVFWTPAYEAGDFPLFRFNEDRELRALLRGAWYFTNRGGPRHLGYRFGEVWATRHTGSRLCLIRRWLKVRRGNLVEQKSRVVRWVEQGQIYRTEIRRDCPALGSRWISQEAADSAKQVPSKGDRLEFERVKPSKL